MSKCHLVSNSTRAGVRPLNINSKYPPQKKKKKKKRILKFFQNFTLGTRGNTCSNRNIHIIRIKINCESWGSLFWFERVLPLVPRVSKFTSCPHFSPRISSEIIRKIFVDIYQLRFSVSLWFKILIPEGETETLAECEVIVAVKAVVVVIGYFVCAISYMCLVFW